LARVLARIVFDACVVAAWLNEPKVDATEQAPTLASSTTCLHDYAKPGSSPRFG
jgi:hypothetical protein